MRRRGRGVLAAAHILMPADPKPEPRIIDTRELRRARLMGWSCASCHGPPSNAHHVIPKGAPYHGDDVIGNIVMLCGSGTMGCHGAIHGSPYVDDRGKRWTEETVRVEVGKTIVRLRPDVIAYAITKLGDVAGMDYLARRYFVGRS